MILPPVVISSPTVTTTLHEPVSPATAIAGLEDVIEMSYGSANHLPLPDGAEPIFNIDGLRLAAKTGTAQAPPWRHDIDGDGVIEADERLSGVEHAWVVALAGPADGELTHVISVLVEYGGSGGRAAGPIANQVMHALRAEGLLDGGRP